MSEKRFEYNHIKGYNDYIYDVTDNRMMWELDCICELLNNLHEENQHYKHILQDLGLLMTDEEVRDIRTEIADKFIKQLCKENGFDIDVDCTNGFTIIPKGDDNMTVKRFIEFATQNTDDGEINNGFQDIKTGEWYYTKDSENAEKICGLLNELHEESQIKLEMVDAFILGMEDEKGIAPEDKEFQCRMNHTIRVLQRLKEDMLNPTEFNRLKEL